MRIIYIRNTTEDDHMDFKQTAEKAKNKAKEIIKKVNKKTWIACGAVLLVGIAVLLNILLIPDNNEAENSGVIDPALDLSNVSATINEMNNEENASSSAFAEMTLTRQQARDEAMEVLYSLANSDTATDDAKAEAIAEIEDMAACIECEANIESLIKAKGFEECVAVISGNSASVIVKTDGLAQNQIAQISEIVYKEAGVLPTNLNIIESN